jgi:hypothetical protein
MPEANGRAAVPSALDILLTAHANAIDELEKKIEAIPGAVDDSNREQFGKLVGRLKTQYEWFTQDVRGSVPPHDRPQAASPAPPGGLRVEASIPPHDRPNY